ncbi:unnamed protein product [Owenia fusiformis]|uniref:SMP-30/Gluconolactonase/LRE-like region domain-containing protein n=1 Tax=Owenia fusiformis TaxID=6347 RepID=A0A8S4N4G5_OWEFU|nr:unnamed protein product [Owenia fusiformis]
MATKTEMNFFAADFVKILDNQPGSEGPVFTMDGKLYMVAPEVEVDGKPAGQILRIDLEIKQASVLVAPSVDGFGGIPAGCQCDLDNNIWVADMTLGILKVKQDGTFQQIATKDNKNEALQGCNDLIFDCEGNLWITAPAGPIAPHAFTRSDKEAFGSAYCYTKAGEVIKVATGFKFSNGIAVQHNSNGIPVKLIVAETFHNSSLWSFDIVGPGQVKNKQLWGTLPGNPGPDGMDFDEEGNLIVANHGSGTLDVFGPNGGEPICRIKCPFKHPSNVHFRPDSDELYVTEHEFHGLWKLKWKNKGMKQFCERI